MARSALSLIGGATLLATKPAKILFEPSVVITADMSLKNGLLSGLKINGTDIALTAKGPVRGGSLAAQFAIRDDLAQTDKICFKCGAKPPQNVW